MCAAQLSASGDTNNAFRLLNYPMKFQNFICLDRGFEKLEALGGQNDVIER